MDAHAVVNFASDDEEVDSDIEAYLYSQLHYSTELNLESDSELVIDRKDTDDEKLPEIIPITPEEPKAEKQNLWAIHEKDLKGADSYLHSFGRKKRYYADTKEDQLKCSKCKERGHFAAECPKVETCHLCGLQGHMRWSCPNDICYNCSEIGHIAKLCRAPKKSHYAVCKRCWGRGHNKSNCPEIWRQYHLTVRERASFTKPRYDSRGVLKSMKKVRYCFNCGGEGHFGHDCQSERPSKRSVNSPFIVLYDRCPFKSRRDNEPQIRNSNKTETDRERYNGTDSRKYEDGRDKSYRSDQGKAYKKHEGDGNMCDRKDKSKIEEAKSSKDKHPIVDKLPVESHESLDNNSKSRKKIDEAAKDPPSSPGIESRVRKLIRSKLVRDGEHIQSTEKIEGRRQADIQKAKRSSYDFERGVSPSRNVDEGQRKDSFCKREPRFAEEKTKKMKIIVLSDDEEVEEIKKEKEKVIDLGSGANEDMKKEKEAVKIHRTHTNKENSAVTDQRECHTRRRAWNVSLSTGERESVKEEPVLSWRRNCDLSSFACDGEEVEFIDLDIYADSDSSLEINNVDHSSSTEAFKEDKLKIAGAKNVIKKEIGKGLDGSEHSTETLHNSCSSTPNEKRSLRNDVMVVDGRPYSDASVKVDESKPDGKCRDTVAEQKLIVGKVGSLKSSEEACRRDRKKEYASRKANLVDTENSSKVKPNAENVGIGARVNNRVDTRQRKLLSVSFEIDSCTPVDRSSKECVRGPRLKPKGILEKNSEQNEIAKARNYDNSKPIGLELVTKSKKNQCATDFMASNDTTEMSQPIVAGCKTLTNHLAKQVKRNISLDNHGLELSSSFGKTKPNANVGSSYGQGKVFGNEEGAVVSPGVISSNRKVSLTNTLPLSVPPFEMRCSDEKAYGEHAQEAAEDLFIEDHTVADDNGAFNGYESLSDVETFQFSNMQFDPVSDSSSDGDLRKTLVSLKSKRSGEQSAAALVASSNSLGHFQGGVLDSVVAGSNSDDPEMSMSPDSADRRQIDMTRYDPTNCNEDDISAYRDYAGHARGNRSSLQSNIHSQNNSSKYGKRRYGVANSEQTSSPFESISAKKRKMNDLKLAASPLNILSEAGTWKRRVAVSLGRQTASHKENSNREERLVSFVGKRQSNMKQKENPANSTTDHNVTKQALLNELEGKGKKARKTLKRKWRQAILENGGPRWLKKLANFDPNARTNAHAPAAKGGKGVNSEIPPRIVKERGLTSSSQSRGQRMVGGRGTAPSKMNAFSKHHQNGHKPNKRSVQINRGFRSSDAAKGLKQDFHF